MSFESSEHVEIASSSFSSTNDVEETELSDLLLETEEEKRSRKRSHWVVHITLFIVCIGFSAVITGVYPYLKTIQNDPNTSKSKLGYIIAAGPVGQMVTSPLIGYAETRVKSIRILFYVTTIFFCVGNLIYGVLPLLAELWEDSAFHVVLVARLFVGISAGNLTICRSYLAIASTQKERTGVLSTMSIMSSLGYVVGPILQMCLNLTVDDDLMKYQAAGFIVASLGLIIFILMLPCIFQEHNLAVKQREIYVKTHVNGQIELPNEDRGGMVVLLFTFFIFQLIYVFMETLLEPFVQDQYGWCDDLAVVVVGVALTCTGVILVFGFLLAPKLAKIMDERLILLVIAFGLSTPGIFMFIPWGRNPLPYCEYNNGTKRTESGSFIDVLPSHIRHGSHHWHWHEANHSAPSPDELSSLFNVFCTNTTECLGCPSPQEWCLTVPQLPFMQLVFAFLFVEMGFPFGIAISNSIYSKMIGPRPQGIWMGILTSAGSLSRILGPLFASNLYAWVGTQYTFGSVVILMAVGVLSVVRYYKRLVPLKLLVPTKI